MKLAASVSLTALALAGCATTAAPPPPAPVVAEAPPAIVAAAPALTPEGAREFVAAAEKDLEGVSRIGSRAAWVNATYITDDTDVLNSYFGTIATEKGVKYATEAAKWLQVPGLDPDTVRKLNLLRGGLTLAAPTTPGAAAELNDITTRLQSAYGKGRARHNGKVITGDDAEALMGTLRDPKQLAEVWQSWHETTGRPMKPDYIRMV
jgi:peptidyl-dipeptidase A